MAEEQNLINEKLAKAKAELPEGFDIVERVHLDTLIEDRKQLMAVFERFKPIINGLAGKGKADIGSIFAQLPTLVPALEKDEQLATAIEYSLKLV